MQYENGGLALGSSVVIEGMVRTVKRFWQVMVLLTVQGQSQMQLLHVLLQLVHVTLQSSRHLQSMAACYAAVSTSYIRL